MRPLPPVVRDDEGLLPVLTATAILAAALLAAGEDGMLRTEHGDGDGGGQRKAGRGDRRRDGRDLRRELSAARRAQRFSRRSEYTGRGYVVRQCRRVQRLVGDAAVLAGD